MDGHSALVTVNLVMIPLEKSEFLHVGVLWSFKSAYGNARMRRDVIMGQLATG